MTRTQQEPHRKRLMPRPRQNSFHRLHRGLQQTLFITIIITFLVAGLKKIKRVVEKDKWFRKEMMQLETITNYYSRHLTLTCVLMYADSHSVYLYGK